jgi:hypothetical protein
MYRFSVKRNLRRTIEAGAKTLDKTTSAASPQPGPPLPSATYFRDLAAC